MYTALRHASAASQLLSAVTRLQQLLPCAAAVAHHSSVNRTHWSLAVTQAGHCQAQHPAKGLLPWHVLYTQPKQEQSQATQEQQQPAGSSKQTQEQQQQPSKAAGQPAAAQQGTKQEQQQEQEQQHQQEQQKPAGEEQDSPLEGPNGLLAEWRVESSGWWSNMFYLVVDSSLNYPQFISWAELYQPKPPGFLRRMLTPEGGSNLTWPLAHMYRQHTLIAEFLLSQAHADWDADTFKEGVKQAIEYSTQLYATSDWVSLKPLVSTALLQSMQHARQLQASAMEAADASVRDVELVIDPESVRLVSATAITREQLAGLDQHRASQALPLIPVGADNEESATVDAAASAASAAAHSATASPVAEGAADLAAWDVAHVYAEGVLRANVSKGGGAVRHVELVKRGHWLLCRGPVHLDRVLSTQVVDKTPWFLLSWL